MMNSFELLSHTIDDRVHIDKEYYYTKEEQCELVLCVKNTSALVPLFLRTISLNCSAGREFTERPSEYTIKNTHLLCLACVDFGIS